MATYELWLTDDAGRRSRLLKNFSFLNYTRASDGLGTCSFGVPWKLLSDLRPYFRPDWRAEVWRKAAPGHTLRLEDAFLLRKPVTYTRQDGVRIVQFYGRNGMDLLKRRSVAQATGTSYAKKTASVDDMMKAFVREQMLWGSALDETGTADNGRAWPEGEFRVQDDGSYGPSMTRDFAGRPVFEVCKDLYEASLQYHMADPTNTTIHFDVVPVDLSAAGLESGARLGWEFRTYAGLRGEDRTAELQFSEAYENIRQPNYSLDHLDEVTAVWVRGNGNGNAQQITSVEDTLRMSVSRWNRVEKTITATNESGTTGLQDAGRVELGKGIPRERLELELLNHPGSATVPSSLYGVNWDLGDRVQVEYAEQQFEIEIDLVYVSVNEDGKEEITGRSRQT